MQLIKEHSAVKRGGKYEYLQTSGFQLTATRVGDGAIDLRSQ